MSSALLFHQRERERDRESRRKNEKERKMKRERKKKRKIKGGSQKGKRSKELLKKRRCDPHASALFSSLSGLSLFQSLSFAASLTFS